MRRGAERAAELDSKSPSRLSLELLAASFVALFQELALIRWLPGQVRVLAYFPNLVLLSAFLGLGLGCLRGGRRNPSFLWPACLLAVVVVASAMSRVAFTQESASEHLFLLYYDLPRDAPSFQGVALPIAVMFVLSALSFVPLGQVVAERLEAFRARAAALRGYCWDILGSLLGVVGFSMVSFAGAFPITWFGIFFAAGLVFIIGGPRRRTFAYLAAAALVVAIVARSERADRYSPYYAIGVDAMGMPGFAVLTNGSLHQYAFPAARGDHGLPDRLRTAREGYHLPYAVLGRPILHALVVGAGTGNDVAVLLDQGAERIDAVEIDPAILELGSRHPDRPYASPRVRAINADARSFLGRPGGSYDLIVFGTLDSMTRLSALSNVRLDNFVYTVDCLRQARERLTPDGGLIMYYMVPSDYIDRRLVGMLARVFEETPLVVSRDFALFNRILMVGPAFAGQRGGERQASAPEVLGRIEAAVELPSDDWPYLYLKRREITPFYLRLIAAFAGFAVLGVVLVSEPMRRSLRGLGGADWQMFLFGLGFLLLETRSVTEMNLLWGGTWLTSAVVFGAILAVVLVATLVTQIRPLPFQIAILGLSVALVAAYAVPARLLVGSSAWGKLGFSALFVGAPVFFAALAFATLFRDRERAATAFGWNLLGAVAGGLLEFASMALGLKALLLVALAAYLLALLIGIRSHDAVTSAAPSHTVST